MELIMKAMKQFVDPIQANTSNRELSKIAKDRVKKIKKKEGSIVLTGKKGIRFAFSNIKQRDEFSKRHPQ